jgi:hypothetical protein
MNIKALALLGGALIAGPMAATAQMETLTYSGGQLTGTLEQANYVNGNLVSTSTSALDGSITGSITLDSPLPLFGTTTLDPDAVSGSFETLIGGDYPPMVIPGESQASFSFATRNGAIVGWDFELSECPCYGNAVISLSSSSGDSFSIDQYLSPGSLGTGSTLSGSASGPGGSWQATEAPEIDATSATGGVALLVGALVVMRGRKTSTGC